MVAAGREFPGEPKCERRSERFGVISTSNLRVLESEYAREGLPGLRRTVEGKDSLSARPEIELRFGAEHPRRALATNRHPSDPCSAGEAGPDGSERIALSRGDLRGAADDLDDTLAPLHTADPEAVRIRVGGEIVDPAHDHTLEAGGEIGDGFEGEAPRGEALLDLLGRSERTSGTRLEPPVGDVHRLDELGEETDVVFDEEAEVRNPVTQEANPPGTHPERESRIALGIDAACLEDGGIHHPGPHDLDPLRLGFPPSALAAPASRPPRPRVR